MRRKIGLIPALRGALSLLWFGRILSVIGFNTGVKRIDRFIFTPYQKKDHMSLTRFLSGPSFRPMRFR
jgi:hypothetical protein